MVTRCRCELTKTARADPFLWKFTNSPWTGRKVRGWRLVDGFFVSPPLASSRVAEGSRCSATDKGGLFPLTYRWRKTMPKISGGCLCGAVRYECNAEPLGTAICHCTHCQKVAGSAFAVNVVVPAPSLTWQGQSLASYADKGESGKPLSRKFCRNCGSSLATETEALLGAIIIKAGTLDDKSWLKPNYHIWTNSAQPWVRIEPGATTFSKGRT
jgi:hypothetical protein